MQGWHNANLAKRCSLSVIHDEVKTFSACFAIMVMLLCLLWGGAASAERKPTNPRREHIQQSLRLMQLTPSERAARGLQSNPSVGPDVALTCDTSPKVGRACRFTASVSSGDWAYEFAIQDVGRDSGGYVYYGQMTTSKTFKAFVPYTTGRYRLWVYVYRYADRQKSNPTSVDWNYLDFEVAGDGTHPTLEEKAASIAASCKVSGDAWQTALNLHDWLTRHTYYDTNYEYYGADVLFRGYGVCDAYSKAYELLCQKAGVSVKRVTSNALNHAWNALKIGGAWYHVDPTWDDPAGVKKAVSGSENYNYFCLDDATLAVDHEGGDWTFTGCKSMDANYYVKTRTWQQFGMEMVHDEAGTHMVDHTAALLDALNAGQASVSAERWWNFWLYTDQDGASWYTALKDVQFLTYLEGLRRYDWVLERGGAVNVRIEYDDEAGVLTADLLSWKLKETGTLTLPKALKRVGKNTFAAVRKPTTLVIPAGCETIDEGAFSGSGVRTVFVPDTLVTLAGDAFANCGRIIFVLNRQNDAVEAYAAATGDFVVYK